jgi:hypothetical protein
MFPSMPGRLARAVHSKVIIIFIPATPFSGSKEFLMPGLDLFRETLQVGCILQLQTG